MNMYAEQNEITIMRNMQTGGFTKLCHNELVSITADLTLIICKDIRKEPKLTTSPNSNDKPRVDV